MPATIHHELTATTPDATSAEIRPSHWNAALLATIALAAASEVSGAFSNANGISFGESGGKVTASYTVPAQSVQTQPAGNIVGAGATTTTAAGDKIAATQNSNGLLLAVPPYLTTYAAQTVQTQPAGNIAGAGFTTTTAAGAVIAGTHNSAGLLLAVPGYLTTQTVQTQASGAIARTGFTTTTIAGDKIAGTLDSGRASCSSRRRRCASARAGTRPRTPGRCSRGTCAPRPAGYRPGKDHLVSAVALAAR